jgi:hypothetical protein
MLSKRDRNDLRTVVSGIGKDDPLLAWRLRPVWRSSLGRMRANRAETAAIRQAGLRIGQHSHKTDSLMSSRSSSGHPLKKKPSTGWNFAERSSKVEPLDLSIVGFRVMTVDGPVGRIGKPIGETVSSYYMTLSLGWLFPKSCLVPLSAVKSVDRKQRKLFLSWSKAQLKQASR